MELFRVEIVYSITTSLNDDGVDELDAIRIGDDGFLTDFGYWDIVNDPIMQISPKCIVPKGKTYRKFFSEVLFQSGNIGLAVGKPDALIKLIETYEKEVLDRLKTSDN